tara:strand:- start:134023 stop:134994 length:972 start_codon:yes stop_codon:yes gene_type:complete
MLVNYDEDWIEDGNVNSATYTNLPHGEYTLLVQGANSAGVWNRDGLSLQVIVAPPPWLSAWAYGAYSLIALLLSWLSRRTYDSFAIERKARSRAREMNLAIDLANDDVQGQIEIQTSLVESAHTQNLATISLVDDFLRKYHNQLPDDVAEYARQSGERSVTALTFLDSCITFHGKALYADLHLYADMLIEYLMDTYTLDPNKIATINQVSSRVVPVNIASQLAIIMCELFDNCLQHAFDDPEASNFAQISLSIDTPSPFEGDEYKLMVCDSGVGIPKNILQGAPSTSGLAIVQTIVNRIDGELSIKFKQGSIVTITCTGKPEE